MKSTVGILLAGGLSRRYGSPKAFATLDGAFFYEKTYAVLRAVCDEVVVVTREELLTEFPTDYHVITDIDPFVGCGPLAGIYAAMVAVEAEQYVVLPCDMPLIETVILEKLIERHQSEITVVEVSGRLQPLVSVWNVSVKEKILDALQAKRYRIQDVFDTSSIMKVDSVYLTNQLEVFMNVNTPKQDKEMREWLKS